MEALNKQYSFMNDEMNDWKKWAESTTAVNTNLNLSIIDMTIQRIRELYPEMPSYIIKPGEKATTITGMLKDSETRPEWLPKMAMNTSDVIAAFKWNALMIMTIAASPFSYIPAVTIAFTINDGPMLMSDPEFYNFEQTPDGMPVHMVPYCSMAITGLNGSNVNFCRQTTIEEMTPILELYKQLSQLPIYAKRFGIFKPVNEFDDLNRPIQ